MATNTRSFALSEFPHLKERLEALVQRDTGLVKRLWDKFRTWSYADLKAALDISREDLLHVKDVLLPLYDKDLKEQGIEVVEILVMDSPNTARRIDVPAPLLEADVFNEIHWEYDIRGTPAWQWKWMERKVHAENAKSKAVYKNQVLRRMLAQIEEYDAVSDEPDFDPGSFFIFDSKLKQRRSLDADLMKVIQYGLSLKEKIVFKSRSEFLDQIGEDKPEYGKRSRLIRKLKQYGLYIEGKRTGPGSNPKTDLEEMLVSWEKYLELFS